MPKWVKVVLVVVLVGFVALVAGVIIAAQWVRNKGARMQEQGKVLVSEAQEFGRGKEAGGCVTESLRRLGTCPGFICETKVKVFLTSCLQSANESPELCDGVPPPGDLMDGARWQMAECRRRGFAGTDQRCMRTVSTLQMHCAQLRADVRQ